jgi:hypothetical protein
MTLMRGRWRCQRGEAPSGRSSGQERRARSRYRDPVAERQGRGHGPGAGLGGPRRTSGPGLAVWRCEPAGSARPPPARPHGPLIPRAVHRAARAAHISRPAGRRKRMEGRGSARGRTGGSVSSCGLPPLPRSGCLHVRARLTRRRMPSLLVRRCRGLASPPRPSPSGATISLGRAGSCVSAAMESALRAGPDGGLDVPRAA